MQNISIYHFNLTTKSLVYKLMPGCHIEQSLYKFLSCKIIVEINKLLSLLKIYSLKSMDLVEVTVQTTKTKA